MMLRVAEFGWALVGVLAISACGGSDSEIIKSDPTTIAIPADITEEEFAALVADIGCNAVGPCCAEVGHRYNAGICTRSFANVFALTPRLGLGFNHTAATECLKALQRDAVDCGGLPAACGQVYSGIVQPGGSCEHDRQCEATAQQEVSCDIVVDWTCKLTDQGALGEPCDQTCYADGEGFAGCFDTYFAATSSYGSPAVSSNAHVTCDRASGLYCDSLSAKCEPLADVGSSCSNSTQCAVGSACYLSVDGTYTCQPLVAVGQPCSRDGIPCTGDSYCDADGTCHKPKMKADGDSCSEWIECVGECNGGRCAEANLVNGFSNYVAEAICGREMI